MLDLDTYEHDYENKKIIILIIYYGLEI